MHVRNGCTKAYLRNYLTINDIWESIVNEKYLFEKSV